MIIRTIRPEEIKRVRELFSVAFQYVDDNTKTAEQTFEETIANTTSRQDKYWQNHFAAFMDDDRTLMSAFVAIPYPVQFDGNQCDMIGIGGVSTFPQFRRSGGVRGCFEMALPWMKESGAVFSYLYPFSTAYYRKFGYEMGCRRRLYKLLMEKLPRYQVTGDCYLLEQGTSLKEDIKTVYRAWQNRYNMMVVGEDYEFAWIDKANPPKDQTFTYLYKSSDGVPMGYVTFKLALENNQRNLHCSRFHFTCPEGFKGLIRLIATLASDHTYVFFSIPEDWDLEPLMPEWSLGAAECSLRPSGMVRIVNVEKALLMANIPGEGTLRIAINDPHIPSNSGCYQIAYAPNTPNTVTLTNEAPQAEMDINFFSSLLLGVYETDAIAYMPGVITHVPLATLAPLFHKKKSYICENF